ncbi:hypothetical protein [uncultured Hymenobacter sp.]|uniref:hypothetical protein n=1 Tax=uncultured Hymenobacter sp. TaxID=170016 RepID=UPI0035C9C673
MNKLRCPNCGCQFESLVQISAGMTATFEDAATLCPNCGQEVNLAPSGIDGTFRFDEHGNATQIGFINLLRSVNLPPTSLTALKAVVTQAQASNASLPDLTLQVSRISPELGEKLNSFFQKHQYTLIALGLLVTVLSYFKPDAPATVTNNYYFSKPELPKQEILTQRPRLNAAPIKRGNNLTAPLSKKAKAQKKNRRK